MTKPYGLMADCHLHNWSQFASTDEEGRNTRLMGLIGEMQRCVDHVRYHGGDTVYIAGDLFHVRGNIKPSVFNEAYAFFKRNYSTEFVIIAGNHDLETKVSADKSSALTALNGLINVTTVGSTYPYSDDDVVAIPWIEDITVDTIRNLLDVLEANGIGTKHKDLILHASLDGVLPNVSGGLNPEELAELPVRNIYCGHFHHNKTFFTHAFAKSDNKRGLVVSIGSIAQFSFGEKDNDVGFLIVNPMGGRTYERVESTQPKYKTVNLSGVDDIEGNQFYYLKVVVDGDVKPAELTRIQKELLGKHWCKGVIFQMVPKQVERTGYIVSAGSSLETSVNDYISKMENLDSDFSKELGANCQRILKETEMP